MACSQEATDADQVIDMFENSDLLQCAVCFNIFKKPKVLPCHHTFCLECLEQTFRVYQGRGESETNPVARLVLRMPCPTCRAPVRIPRAGIPGLPDDFRVTQLLDMLSTVSKMGLTVKNNTGKFEMINISHSTLNSTIICELCKVLGKKYSAEKYCPQCGKLLCSLCIQKHDSEAFREHRMYDIVLCIKHASEVIKYYCKDCSEIICVACLMEYHKDHSASEVQNEFSDPGEVQTFVESIVNKKIDQCSEYITKLEEVSESLSVRFKEAGSDVNTRLHALMFYIEMHGKELLEFLENESSKQKESISDRIEQLEMHRAILDAFKGKKTADIFASMKHLNEMCSEIQGILSEDLKNYYTFVAEQSFPDIGTHIPARLEQPRLAIKPKTGILDKPLWLKTVAAPFCDHTPSYYEIKSIAMMPSNEIVCLLGTHEMTHVCVLSERGQVIRCVNPMINATDVFGGDSCILLLSEHEIKVMWMVGGSQDRGQDRNFPVDLFNNYQKSYSSCCYMPGGFVIASVTEESKICILDLQGNVVKDFKVTTGVNDLKIHEPKAIYHTTTKEIIVHDTADDALYRFSPEGVFYGALLDEGGTKKKFIGAYSDIRILEGKLGHIIVMEKYNRRVNVFSPSGKFMKNLFSEYEHKDELPNQEGAAISSDGQLLIATADKIDIYQLYD